MNEQLERELKRLDEEIAHLRANRPTWPILVFVLSLLMAFVALRRLW